MMLLKTVEPGQATGSVAKVYATFDRVGVVPLPMQLLSASPGLQERQSALVNYFMSHPKLGVGLLAAIRYVAAQLSCHDSCVSFNGALLQRLGVTAEEMESLSKGGVPACLEEREAALLAFVRRALSAPESVTTSEVEALRRLGWTDSDVLDAVAHGANLVGNSFLHKAFVRE
jgi:alkylhydroperoxidase family enzyme